MIEPTEPVIDYMIDRDSMAYRVLSLAKLNDAASVAAHTHNLPKGSTGPRCDVSPVSDHNTGPVSGRMLRRRSAFLA